jgi:hypothetical protein
VDKLAAAIRPFSDSGYEILDEEIAGGRVVIWSVDPVTPRLGDSFLIESDGELYDVAVVELVTLRGGWSATCRGESAARGTRSRRPYRRRA